MRVPAVRVTRVPADPPTTVRGDRLILVPAGLVMRVRAALGTRGQAVPRTKARADLCIQGQEVLRTTVLEVRPILVLAVRVTRGPVGRATQVQAELDERVPQYADDVEPACMPPTAVCRTTRAARA